MFASTWPENPSQGWHHLPCWEDTRMREQEELACSRPSWQPGPESPFISSLRLPFVQKHRAIEGHWSGDLTTTGLWPRNSLHLLGLGTLFSPTEAAGYAAWIIPTTPSAGISRATSRCPPSLRKTKLSKITLCRLRTVNSY